MADRMMHGGADADPAPTETKADAQYVEPAPSPEVRCRNCTMFRPPAGCITVMGRISPFGHCRYFEAVG